MEVDALKPKSTPLPDEVILWFEFLLKPNLLSMHLKKLSPDPSPIDLIQQFLSVAPEAQIQGPTEPSSPDSEASKNESLKVKMGRKQLALKILALKVAAHLKFNLDVIEKNLPLLKQIQLLSDLCTVASGKIQSLPISLVNDCMIGPDGSKQALNFALTLYHRFVLRAQVRRGCQTKTNKILMIPPGPDPSLIPTRDDYFISSMEALTQNSIDFLNQIMQDTESLKLLTYDCFVALDANSENTSQKFDLALPISKTEVKTQICFDLCLYFMFVKNYELARQNVIACRDSLQALKHEYALKGKQEFLYCTFDEEELEAYLLACGVFNDDQGILHLMNESIMSQYKGVTAILKEDNVKQEIPVVQRKILELDIEGSISTQKLKDAKDVYFEVVALNTIRYVLNEGDIVSCDTFIQRYKTNDKALEIFFKMLSETYDSFDLSQKNKLKQYVLNLLTVLTDAQIATHLKPSSVFTQKEIENLKHQKSEDAVTVSGIGTSMDWAFTEGKTMLRLEVAMLERQLFNCTNAKATRGLLVKLAGMNPSKPLWSINPSWVVPEPIRTVILSLPRGFLQDFSYVLTGKAKELAAKNDYGAAVAMLNVIKNETQRSDFASNPNVVKLGKLIQWETLLIQIQQCLEEWPKKPADPQALIRNCKQCLLALTNNDNVIPRIEILEYCSVMLLNLCEWQSVVLTERRIPSLDLCSAFATAIIDIDKLKGQKKINKEAWDLILPVFAQGNSSGNKRPGARDSRDSPSLPQVTNLNAFLKKLRDPLIISIVLSLLCRLHNALKDDGNYEINAEYMFLWPATVSNGNGYNIKYVAETINALLKQAFKYYPNNIPWIKLKGDLEYVNGSYEAAMKHYVTALVSGTEYCTLILQRPVIDEHVVRRMIKCTSSLGCYMQAAILCQFLDETDYGLAFKSISEKTSSFSDAMDAYYGCIWDPTLLEFIINMHSKKGEHKRKLQAISYMGLLELNANNNDEIKREAASARKTKFLRSLAKQYML